MADEGFWCPTLIDSWRSFLRRGVPDDDALRHRRAFLSNVGYNLQHLQYLNYQVNEVHLHSTVYTQTLKSFVITGMGVVEAIAWYLLKRNGWQKRKTGKRLQNFKRLP